MTRYVRPKYKVVHCVRYTSRGTCLGRRAPDEIAFPLAASAPGRLRLWLRPHRYEVEWASIYAPHLHTARLRLLRLPEPLRVGVELGLELNVRADPGRLERTALTLLPVLEPRARLDTLRLALDPRGQLVPAMRLRPPEPRSVLLVLARPPLPRLGSVRLP